MKSRHKLAILAAAMAPLAALAVTGGGVASAAAGSEITNMGLHAMMSSLPQFRSELLEPT
jgi:hypothetical protein